MCWGEAPAEMKDFTLDLGPPALTTIRLNLVEMPDGLGERSCISGIISKLVGANITSS